MTRQLWLRLTLPFVLVAWAMLADRNVALPVYGDLLTGGLFLAGGVLLAALGWWQRAAGDGPREIRYWVRHPVYTGLVGVCLGVSMAARSPAGLWLVTPVLALGCAVLAAGGGRTWLPPNDERRPTTAEGSRFFFVVVVPWLLIFGFTSHMRLPGTAFRFAFEDQLPVLPWTAFVYETSYLTVTFAPFWTSSNRQLRQLMITAWVAMAVVFPIYWLLPSAAPRRPMMDHSWIAHLLMEERKVPPGSAFPSFHVLWAIFVGRLWPRWMWAAYSVVIAVSCITTGMHYIPDVLAAFALAPLLLEPGWLLKRVSVPWAGGAFLGLLLLRLWGAGCPWPMVSGVFFIGSGLLGLLTRRTGIGTGCLAVGAVLTTIP